MSNRKRLAPPFSAKRLSARARAESLSSTLADRLDGEIWIFGYASLMWKPDVAYIDRRLGIIRGYQRRLNVWTVRARGTPEHPGLGFGLERSENGSCQGVVYCLDLQAREQDLVTLWEREVATGIYRPFWLTVETGEGNLEAITFVVDEAHPQYVDSLTQEQMATAIAGAHGEWGSCRDYFRRTMRELTALGIDEPELQSVLSMMEALE
ncbi:MAG: gamma-glutamylcyclotransferase [Acidiferrobacterales bacterium]